MKKLQFHLNEHQRWYDYHMGKAGKKFTQEDLHGCIADLQKAIEVRAKIALLKELEAAEAKNGLELDLLKSQEYN